MDTTREPVSTGREWRGKVVTCIFYEYGRDSDSSYKSGGDSSDGTNESVLRLRVGDTRNIQPCIETTVSLVRFENNISTDGEVPPTVTEPLVPGVPKEVLITKKFLYLSISSTI